MNQGLTLTNVTTGYRDRSVLERINLPPLTNGSLTALVGPNAAGKSTLLKTIAGLNSASGDIRLDDEDLSRLSLNQRLRRIGYLPQTLPQASTLTAYEILLSGLRAGCPELPHKEAETLIEQVLTTLGLQKLALRRLNELSGGQRQMIGLAQVIARQPRVLLLDEPTSALDLRWQLMVLETIRRLAEKHQTIALIAIHDLNLALRFCDRIIVLGQGSVLADGNAKNVFNAELLQHAYGIEARVENCSLGYPIVLVDRAYTTTASEATIYQTIKEA